MRIHDKRPLSGETVVIKHDHLTDTFRLELGDEIVATGPSSKALAKYAHAQDAKFVVCNFHLGLER